MFRIIFLLALIAVAYYALAGVLYAATRIVETTFAWMVP